MILISYFAIGLLCSLLTRKFFFDKDEKLGCDDHIILGVCIVGWPLVLMVFVLGMFGKVIDGIVK